MSLTTRNRRNQNRKNSNRRNGKYGSRTTLQLESLENRRLLAGLDCAPLGDVDVDDSSSPAAEIAPSQESVGATRAAARSMNAEMTVDQQKLEEARDRQSPLADESNSATDADSEPFKIDVVGIPSGPVELREEPLLFDAGTLIPEIVDPVFADLSDGVNELIGGGAIDLVFVEGDQVGLGNGVAAAIGGGLGGGPVLGVAGNGNRVANPPGNPAQGGGQQNPPVVRAIPEAGHIVNPLIQKAQEIIHEQIQTKKAEIDALNTRLTRERLLRQNAVRTGQFLGGFDQTINTLQGEIATATTELDNLQALFKSVNDDPAAATRVIVQHIESLERQGAKLGRTLKRVHSDKNSTPAQIQEAAADVTNNKAEIRGLRSLIR